MFSFLDSILVFIFISIITITILCINNIMDNAKSKAFIVETKNNITQIKLFKEKYKFLPGDLPFAQKFFNNVQNGNGNELVEDRNETFFAWQHLLVAKLINSNFTNFNLTYAKIYANMQYSNNSLCGYQIIADSKLNNIFYNLDEKSNFLRIALDKGFGNLTKSCLSSAESHLIDVKLDDGLPVSGNILADNGYNENGCICILALDYAYCKDPTGKKCILQHNIK